MTAITEFVDLDRHGRVAVIHGSTAATTRGSWVIRSEGAGKKACFLARPVANRLECRFPMGRTQ